MTYIIDVSMDEMQRSNLLSIIKDRDCLFFRFRWRGLHADPSVHEKTEDRKRNGDCLSEADGFLEYEDTED